MEQRQANGTTMTRRIGQASTAATLLLVGATGRAFAHAGHPEAAAGPAHSHGGIELGALLLATALGLALWRALAASDT